MLRPAIRQILFGGLPSINPLSLFSAGQQGGWWEAFDQSTLFQDSAGTTPVTAAGQPDGLLLDKSKGFIFGAELAANGKFAANTDGWSTSGSGSLVWNSPSNVTLTCTSGAPAYAYAYMPDYLPLVAGEKYLVTATVTDMTCQYILVSMASSNAIRNSDFGTSGTKTTPQTLAFICSPTLDRGSVWFAAYGVSGQSATYTNVTVRRISENYASQATAAARPIYQISPASLTVDRADDRLQVTVPAGGFVGTLVLSTPEGTLAYGVNIPAGTWSLGANSSSSTAYFPGTAVVGALVRNGALSQTEIDQLYRYFKARGGGPSGAGAYAGVTSMASYFRGANWLTSIPTMDVSAVTNFSYFMFSCTSLTTLDVSGWDTGLVTNFQEFARNCTNLTTLAVGTAFDTSPCTNYTNAFTNCALNQASVDAILVSINAAGTSNGTLNINGGTSATPSATGQTATDALRARGWTVTLNGY